MALLQSLGKLAKSFSSSDDENLTAVRTVSKNVIGFYGVMSNTGNTSLCAHVAKALNTGDKPVVIVDLNAECPTVYKYFIDEVPQERSILSRLRNPTFPITELINSESLKTVSIVSFCGQEFPQDYASVDKLAVTKLINELASRFEYVLIDIGPNLNDDLTTYSLINCNRVYTTVRPIESQLEKLTLSHANFENFGYKNLFYNIIQCQCINNALDAKVFTEAGLRLFANVNYDYEIMKQADNCDFVNPAIKNKNVKGFLTVVDAVSEDIRKFVERSVKGDVK